MPNTTLWELVLIQLQIILDEYAYKNWFLATKEQSIKEGILTVGTPSEFFANYVHEHYHQAVEQALSQVPEATMISKVVFVPSQELATQEVDAGRVGQILQKTMPQRTVQAELTFSEPAASFETLVEHVGNQKAVKIGKLIAESVPGSFFPIFVLIGPPGTGKTTLAKAMRRKIWQLHPNREDFKSRSVQFTAKYFTDTFIAGTHGKNKESMAWIKKIRTCEFIIIDDFHLISGNKPGTQEELFDIIKDMAEVRNPKGQIVITMNCPLSEVKLTADWMASVLKRWSFVATTAPLDLSARIAIMKSKIVKWTPEVRVDDEALELIANAESNGDSRETEGILNQARAEALLDHRHMTLELVREVITARLGQPAPKQVTAQSIIEIVAKTFNIRIEGGIKSCSREKRFMFPRQIAMWLCKQHTNLSDEQIAQKFDKNRSTVIHAINGIAEKLDDPVLRESISAIERALGVIPAP